MMPLSRLGCPLSLKTPNMGNPGTIRSGDETLTILYVANLSEVTEETPYGLAWKGDSPELKDGGQLGHRRAALDSSIQMNTQATSSQPTNDRTKSSASNRGIE